MINLPKTFFENVLEKIKCFHIKIFVFISENWYRNQESVKRYVTLFLAKIWASLLLVAVRNVSNMPPPMLIENTGNNLWYISVLTHYLCDFTAILLMC